MNHLPARVLSRHNHPKELLFSVLGVCLLAILLGILSLSRVARGGAEAAGMGIQDACPMVSQLSPATGIPGSNLMVTGSNLGTVTGVKFAGDVAAAFSVVNNSTLNVVIPNGASTGPLTLSKAGCPDVQTTSFAYNVNLSPNNELAIDDGTGEAGFAANVSPLWFVNRLTPTSYPATVTKLAIFFNLNSGTAFDLIVGTNPTGSANIDGAKFVVTPAMVSGVGSYTVYDVPPVTITSGDFLIGFRRAASASVTPGAVADTNSQARNRSYISGDGATFTQATLPGQPFVNFLFRAGILQGCPIVTGVSPMAGAAGTSVTLTGANLTGVTGVRFFNNATAQYTIFGVTQITTTVPNAAITGPITLSKTGCPAMTTPVFLVGACPSVSGISATSAAVGANVTITGTNFTGATAVKFANNVPAAFTVNSNTQITTTVPSGAVTGPITVSKPDCLDAQTASFTVLACPTVAGINPASGTVGGSVTITGTNFTGITSVKFANNVTASFTVNSATSITATIPAGAVTGSITLSKPDCPDAQTASFAICPAISITPTSLPDGMGGTAYSQTLTASGGTASYSFAVTAGALPGGLTLTNGGMLSGTPNVVGTFNFTVTATDANGCIGTRNFTVNIIVTLGAQTRALYVLSDRTSGNQIYGYAVNETTGALTLLPGFPLLTGGNGAGNFGSGRLTIDRANQRLYAINQGSNTVSAFAINSISGALSPLPFSPISLGNGSWDSIAVHPSGSPLVVGRNSDPGDKVLSFHITATTAIAAAGSPYNTASAFPANAAFSQDGNYVYLGGGSNNLIAGFRVNAATGALTALAGSPFDSGTANPIAYTTDITGRLFVAKYFAGEVRAFTTLSGIPSAVSSNPFPSGLREAVHGVLHPNGFYLVADRGSLGELPGNRVGVYRISGSGGATTLAAVTGSPFAAGGTATHGLTLNQAGTFLFAANANSRNLTTFSVNPTTGALTSLGTQPTNTLGTSGTVTGMDYLASPCPTIALSPATLPGGAVGTAYNQAVAPSPSGNYNFSIAAGALPAGLSLNPVTGAITGTPATAGTANFTITALSFGPCSGSLAYSITIQQACSTITIAPASLTGGTTGLAYSQSLTASGGTAPYSFAVSAGALPGGLTLTSGGTLSGTPNAAGTFNFTVTATDANGCTGTRSFTVNIAAAPNAQLRALYVLNECNGCENQIYGYGVNEATGALTLLPGFPVLTGGNGGSGVYSERLAIDRANRRLYAINDSTDTVSAYAINSTTGGLTPLPFSPINLGSGTWVTVAVHPSGSPLVVGDGNILNRKLSSYQITATTASPAFGSPYNTGSAVAFSAAFSQDGNYLYTGGTAFNNVFAGFGVNAANGVLTALTGSPFNSGATNPLAYATDASGRLFLANVDAGHVRAFTTVGGVPDAVSGNPFASGLTSIIHGILHPNGFYLVADRSSRVGIYQINGSGSATTLNAVPGSPFITGGIEADVLALNQAGTLLFVADGSGRNLKTFNINPTTGTLAFFATQPANTLGTSGRLNGMAYFAPPCETISLSPATLPGGTVGASYNQTVSASPAGNYNFSLIAGALPAGLSLNAATGAITGTPTVGGTANFTITATGAGGCSGSRAYSITIQAQCPAVTGVSPTTVTVGGVVTINGSGFTGVSAVRFANNVTANFAVVSDTQITATVPNSAVSGPVTISKIGCADVQTAPLVIQPASTPRLVRVVNASGAPGSQVMVPIELVSQGNENALGFSLNFNTTILSNPQASLGSGAPGGQITSNPSQIAQGRLGVLVSLPSGQRFSAGTRQIAVITFTIAANAAAGTTTISFGDQPLAREISDPEANVLSADYVAGAVTIVPGFEADVSPRPQGSNDGTVTVTDYVQVGRFVARLDMPAPGSEFQRADCAPRASLGDGRLTVTDYVQAGRYATGLDPVTTAGGPAEPVSQLSVVRGQLPKTTDNRRRAAAQVRAAQETLAAAGLLAIELDAQGGENALAFSLQFDPAHWHFVSALAGEDTVGITLHVNAEEVAAGRIGVLLALPAGETFAAGTHKVALLRFAPVPGRRSASVIGFADQPLAREVVNADAEQVPAEYAVRTEAFTATTAVSVSAASFDAAELASESIAAAFGVGLAIATQAAESLPLPFDLAGTRVTVRDSEGVERQAPLFFVSPGQVNYLIPADTAAGLATVTITSADGAVSIGTVRIAAPAPGLFAANADGQGITSAILLRTRADGSQQFEPVSRFDSKLNRVVATPVDLGLEGEQVFLILFGTGLRHHKSPVTTSAEIGGVPAEVLFIGPAPGFAGLDQCNVRLPRNLVGRGEVEISLTVDGKAANPVNMVFR